MSLSENLQFRRQRRGVTQEQLAEELDVSRQSVSKWESGVSYPEMDTILKLCDIFHVDMDTLLRGSAERTSGVVDEVRSRVRTSDDSVRNLSALAEELSAALEEISSSTAVINTNADGTQGDARAMAKECEAITAYSAQMRERAEIIEEAAKNNMEMVHNRTNEIMAMLNKAIEIGRAHV